jgi:hypothetical protein
MDASEVMARRIVPNSLAHLWVCLLMGNSEVLVADSGVDRP